MVGPGAGEPAEALPEGFADTEGEGVAGAGDVEDVVEGDSEGGADGGRQASSCPPWPPGSPHPVTRPRTTTAPSAMAFHPPVTLPMTTMVAPVAEHPHRFHGFPTDL
ncbi:hypothetical protein AB0D12_06845 [Streptomyces sp. NPDC048479]|uniref:hypothetical protein n=1 Tax=Streptomyces sp. NPDC048479 TaxID=3154725 RepID=UPI0034249508